MDENLIFKPLNPPARLLMGPGPINVDPRVLQAMARQLIGQYDPVMTDYMNKTMALYRLLFQTKNPWTFLIDGTSRAGIEAILMSVLKPDDKVLIPVFGRFGLLLCEIAKRCRANIHILEVPWGQVFKPEQIETAIKAIRPKMLLTVHGDTSTTMLQPLAEMGEICQRYDVLFYTDATASMGGNSLLTDTWHLDAVSSGLQKCLGGPPGSSPITLSEKIVAQINKRKHIEEGIRTKDHIFGSEEMIYSNYFDLGMIMDYWGAERLNHHTEATSMLFAAYEAGRLLFSEGVETSILRHKLHGKALMVGIQAMGLEVFGDVEHKMNNVLGVTIPQNIDGEAVRQKLLQDYSIEIGSSFGPLKGKIWRIGTMGYNARQENVKITLNALQAVLSHFGYKTKPYAMADAVEAFYCSFLSEQKSC